MNPGSQPELEEGKNLALDFTEPSYMLNLSKNPRASNKPCLQGIQKQEVQT